MVMDDSVSPEVQQKLSVLSALSLEIDNVDHKLHRFPYKKSLALSHIAANKWLLSSLRSAKNETSSVGLNVLPKGLKIFDPNMPKRNRTFVGMCGEELMRILFKLDQVQSEGSDVVKETRRGLVSRINNELLTKADKYLIQAQAVVTFHNKIRWILQKKFSSEDIKEEFFESNSQKVESDENENKSNDLDDGNESDDEGLSEEIAKQIREDDSEKVPVRSADDTNVEMKGDEEVQDTRKRSDSCDTIRHEPMYRIQQTDEAVLLKVLLPSGEVANDLKFQVKGYNDELLVIGRNFELPFKVNSENYLLHESMVKIITDEEIMIIIPKRAYARRQHAKPNPLFQAQYQRDPRMNNSEPIGYNPHAPRVRQMPAQRQHYFDPYSHQYSRTGAIPNIQQSRPQASYSPFFDNSFFRRGFY